MTARRFRNRIEREVRPGEFRAFGARTVVHPPFAGDRRGAIAIGADTYVLAGASVVFPGQAPDAVLLIGSRTYLGRDLTVLCGDRVTIGDDVMASDRIYVADVEAVPSPDGGPAVLSSPRPVTIGDGVFLGTGAMILPGVSVGARSLVAAGAVVVEDVPENAVVAGNPARVVRRYDSAVGGWVDAR